MLNGDKRMPMVSVLMPAYNCEKYIDEAIESILNQTFKDFELIVVDDCSSDRTWEKIEQWAGRDERVKAVRSEENRKISRTLNRGLKVARGKYVARMDADDWAYPERLAKQVSYMEQNPRVVLSGGTMEVCDKNMKILNQRTYNLTDEKIRAKMFFYSPFCHPAIIFRRQEALEAGGYNPQMNAAQDYDFYFRMSRQGELGNLEDVLLKLRTRNESVSGGNSRKQELLTLYIRIKAVMEYGFSMKWTEKLYWATQLVSMLVIPPRLKFWLFNYLRK